MNETTERKAPVNVGLDRRDASLPDVLRIADICQHLGISRTQLDRIRKTGDFPPPFTAGSHPRWTSKAYLAWIDNGGTQSK